jgi:hypothetical protein
MASKCHVSVLGINDIWMKTCYVKGRIGYAAKTAIQNISFICQTANFAPFSGIINKFHDKTTMQPSMQSNYKLMNVNVKLNDMLHLSFESLSIGLTSQLEQSILLALSCTSSKLAM